MICNCYNPCGCCCCRRYPYWHEWTQPRPIVIRPVREIVRERIIERNRRTTVGDALSVAHAALR